MDEQLPKLTVVESISEPEVDKPGACRFWLIDEGWVNVKMRDYLRSELTRVLLEAFGKQHRDIGRQIAVLGLAGLFKGDCYIGRDTK